MGIRKFFVRWGVFVMGVALLAGCGAGRTMVVKAPDATLKTGSVTVSEDGSPVKIPDEVRAAFQEKLTDQLYKDGAFIAGPGLQLQYRFIQFNPGNQFTRWFWGGIGNAGEGSMTIQAKYLDDQNRELAAIQAEGRIGSGFFGGAFGFAIDKAATEIADYTKQHFK